MIEDFDVLCSPSFDERLRASIEQSIGEMTELQAKEVLSKLSMYDKNGQLIKTTSGPIPSLFLEKVYLQAHCALQHQPLTITKEEFWSIEQALLDKHRMKGNDRVEHGLHRDFLPHVGSVPTDEEAFELHRTLDQVRREEIPITQLEGILEKLRCLYDDYLFHPHSTKEPICILIQRVARLSLESSAYEAEYKAILCQEIFSEFIDMFFENDG